MGDEQRGWPRADGLRTLELGNPGPLRRQLTALVLAGTKTATAGLQEEYDAEGEPLEHVGELLAMVDDDGAVLAHVRVTDVQVVRFADVPDDFCRAEGEGYDGHEDWAVAHRRFWTGEGADVGDDTAVVCLWIELAR